MTKGILIPVFEKRGYAYAAYNLAFSIKRFSPDVKITVICDSIIDQLDPSRRAIFDDEIELPHDWKYTNKKLDPGKVKVLCYDILPYNETLLMDADAIALQDIAPLFDQLSKKEGFYFVHLYGEHRLSDGNIMSTTQWAFADDVWNHFNLKKDVSLPGTNTSIQYIKKCKESNEFLTAVQNNYFNPLPLEKLKNQWGGGQPDELYVSATMAQMNVSGDMGKNYMFFGHDVDARNTDKLKEDYLFLSVYGGKLYTRDVYLDWYDRLLGIYHNETKNGNDHIFKYRGYILNDKHSGIRPSVAPPVRIENQQTFHPTATTTLHGGRMIDGKIKIINTILIDASKLIGEYINRAGNYLRVSNWLNGSFIKYNGKIIFCYRMESKPFCMNMKLGICLLDSDYQPIQETNVLLDLYSDLPTYAKGFHVEDPRLFIHDDELYLSYTDGDQMAQAKINPETLQAEDSFYIDKPKRFRIEKNWTFFSNDRKLYCIYDIGTQRIFEMNGSKWTEVVKTDFVHDWKYGQLRGGTSPILHEGKYIAFFHSALPMENKGVPGLQYFMGAYTFEKEYPFRPISISTEPIIAGEHIEDSIPRLSNKIFVVYPCGAIRENDGWAVSFGYNDLQCRVVKVTDQFLKTNMKEIEYKQEKITA